MDCNADFQPEEGIIFGVDPGTRVMGYGILKEKDGFLTPLDYGCIRPPASLKLTDRYLILYQGILELIKKYRPAVVVVETQYVHRNVQSAIKLGMARGGVVIAARQLGVNVVEYSPTQAKLAVTGSGRASKWQVQSMVQRLLKLKTLPQPEDAADALALAVCHAHAFRMNQRIGKEI